MKRSGLFFLMSGLLLAATLQGCGDDETRGRDPLTYYSVNGVIGGSYFWPWGEEALAMDEGFILKITRDEEGSLPQVNGATVTLDGVPVPEIAPPFANVNPLNQAYYRLTDIAYAPNKVYTVQVNVADMTAGATLRMPALSSVALTGPADYVPGEDLRLSWAYGPAGQFPASVLLQVMWFSEVTLNWYDFYVRVDGKEDAHTIPANVTGSFSGTLLVSAVADLLGASQPFSSVNMPLLGGADFVHADISDTALVTRRPEE